MLAVVAYLKNPRTRQTLVALAAGIEAPMAA
jgi:hypothetical protein